MSFDERLDSISDALYHIKETIDALKQLGSNYLNQIDVLDDIRRQVEIDESITERKLNEYWELEQRALIREYHHSL